MKSKNAILGALLLLQIPVLAGPGEEAPRPQGPVHSTAAVASFQAVIGAASGSVGALGAFFLPMALSGCMGGGSGDDLSDAYGCLFIAYGSAILGVGGFAIGNSLGVYFAGSAMDRHGGYWATLLGAAGGMALGALAAASLDDPAAGTVVFLGLSQAAPILLYHLTDRVTATATFAPPPGAEGAPLTLAAMAQGLRPEVKVELLRF